MFCEECVYRDAVYLIEVLYSRRKKKCCARCMCLYHEEGKLVSYEGLLLK